MVKLSPRVQTTNSELVTTDTKGQTNSFEYFPHFTKSRR
ncbi:Protein of unknown function [Pyronema omphalodes CBS 100304]|uniref:Uncharacterized protein n=1 Tax=Pyronema omphalodes (strain CBS 100304) TaxID=1076935 RepID=U4LUJ8_PYROM|nr:Protein of unknown function [Pyronema omphalodes CBS 100304]